MTLRHTMVVAGARPNFIKVAPIVSELERRCLPTYLLHTGQHYSTDMSDSIFRDLGMRAPDHNLEVGSGTHAQQTARIMESFERVLVSVRPQHLVVVGDVNSTLACALVASKLREELGVRIAHVEAGLRSRNWTMPEEINRVLTDRLSDLLLTPSMDATANLIAEGISEENITFVGNIMIDTLYLRLAVAKGIDMPARLGVHSKPYAVVTLHRPSNVDAPEKLRAVLEGLQSIVRDAAVVFPMHPRTRRRLTEFGLENHLSGLTVTGPLGYLEMLSLMDGARVVLTDSGGVQEETTVLGVPCVTLRQETERPATLQHGTNRMAPWPLSAAGIAAVFHEAMNTRRLALGERVPEGWDGRARERIVDALAARAT